MKIGGKREMVDRGKEIVLLAFWMMSKRRCVKGLGETDQSGLKNSHKNMFLGRMRDGVRKVDGKLKKSIDSKIRS